MDWREDEDAWLVESACATFAGDEADQAVLLDDRRRAVGEVQQPIREDAEEKRAGGG